MILYYMYGEFFTLYYLLSGFLLLSYTLIIFPKTYNIKLIVIIWFIIGPVYISFFIISLWKYSLLSFLWILPLPLGSYFFFSFRTVVYYTIYTLFYIVAIIFISYHIDTDKYLYLSKDQVIITDVFLLICFLSVIILLIYYFNKIKLISSTEKDNIPNKKPEPYIEKLTEDEEKKYNAIFSKVVMYMDKKAPYKKRDFSISELSFVINSNHTYISKAIKLNGYPNFNYFLNTYRINYIKNQLNQRKHYQYTLQYLYSEAGFIHQSTFNRAFKEIEGITPSQYITSLENENNQDS